MKRIIIDLDETISTKNMNDSYDDARSKRDTIEKLHNLKKLGYSFCIFVSRNMRSFNGNIGLINVHTIPIISSWLKKYCVQHVEILIGEPWCGEIS